MSATTTPSPLSPRRAGEASALWLRALLLVALVAGLSGPLAAAPVLAQTAPAKAPSLLEPATGSEHTGNPVLRWSSVPDAARYRVEVSTGSEFAAIAYAVDTIGTAATPPADLPLGLLHWRVSVLDAQGTAGPKTTGSFVKRAAEAPVLVQPANSATLSFPTSPPLFEWKPLAGAKTYEIEIDDDAAFVDAKTEKTGLTSFTLTEPQTAGRYHWRVRGTADGINSQWSETRSYTVTWPATPVLTGPADTSEPTVEDVVLTWEPVPGAATYRLQVSPNGNWSHNLSLDVTVKGTQFSPVNSGQGNSLGNGNYFWRVQALDARATPGTGPWSAIDPATGLPRRFQRAWLDVPALVSPAHGAGITTPTLTWTPVDHASHYEVEMSKDVNFTVRSGSCLTNQTSVTPYALRSDERGTPPDFPGGAECSIDVADDGQPRYWRVRAVDAPAAPEVLGRFSQARSFTFRPDMPVPAPVSGRAHAPVLSWSPVIGHSAYVVTVEKLDGTGAKSEETRSTSYTPTAKLAEGGYRWYVQAKDAAGRTSPVPDQRDPFTVSEPTVFSATPEPLPTVSAGVVAPSLQWRPVEGATEYTVRLRRPGSDVYTPLTPTAGHAAYTPLGVLQPGEWKWDVAAKTPAGTVYSVGTESFTISTLPPVTGYKVAGAAGAPCTTSPCDIGDSPRLTWDHVPGAESYRVYLANDPAFTNRVRVYETQFDTLTPRESLRDSQAGQAYYWFVRPCTSPTTCGALEGELGRAQSFRKASKAVVPVAPAADAVVAASGLRFSWQDYRETNGTDWSQSAHTYRFQVSTVEDFSAALVDDVVVDQISYAPWDKTYPEGPLFWRVQAIDGSGNALPFSAPRRLEKRSGAPEVLAPTSLAVDRLPYFRWTPMTSAVSYELEVAKDGDTAFSPANLVAAGKGSTKQTAFSPVTAFGGQGKYAWRLRAVDVDGRKGAWSEPRVFFLQAPAPVLVAPGAGASVPGGNPVLFDWEPAAGAASYRFQLGTSRNFVSVLQEQATVMTEWAPPTALPTGTHFWRVQVLDAQGDVLGASDPRELTIGAGGPSGPAPVDPDCNGEGPDADGDGRPDRCDDVIDLHAGDQLYPFVRTLMKTGISTGCEVRTFCATASVTRAQMAIFLLRAADGAGYVPPPATGVFADVPVKGFAADYVEELRRRGITTGCTQTKFCPFSGVTRSQMAAFLLRASESSDFKPPAPAGVFTDVPTTMQFADWIEELSARKITSGCTATTYCPGSTVTRRQMAAFLVRAFEIPLA